MGRLTRAAVIASALFMLTFGPAFGFLGCSERLIVYGDGTHECFMDCTLYDDETGRATGRFTLEIIC